VVAEYGITIGSRETDLRFAGWTMPGEHDDFEVGVVSLLLHWIVEPDVWVEGLVVTRGTWGVEAADRLETEAAARARSSGIRVGGKSSNRFFDKVVAGAASAAAVASASLRLVDRISPGGDIELCGSGRRSFASELDFGPEMEPGRVETDCPTKGAFLRSTLRGLSDRVPLSSRVPDSSGSRELFRAEEDEGVDLEDLRLFGPAEDKGLRDRGRSEGRPLTMLPSETFLRLLLEETVVAEFVGNGLVDLVRSAEPDFDIGGWSLEEVEEKEQDWGTLSVDLEATVAFFDIGAVCGRGEFEGAMFLPV
jgi:hypothetical protein